MLPRLVRTRKAYFYIQSILKMTNIKKAYVELIKTFILLMFILHIAGCFWYAASLGNREKSYLNWITYNDLRDGSKIKAYIKNSGDMKTSAGVLNVLSDRLRAMCDQAVESARSDGRKTVLDRDFS